MCIVVYVVSSTLYTVVLVVIALCGRDNTCSE